MSIDDMYRVQPERLKTIMRHVGVNQAGFAKATGIADASISQIVNGKRHIGDAVARKIAMTYPQFPACWIMGGDWIGYPGGFTSDEIASFKSRGATVKDTGVSAIIEIPYSTPRIPGIS